MPLFKNYGVKGEIMKSKRFLKKCVDMKTFEEQTVTYVKRRFERFFKAFDEIELALDIYLSWWNRGAGEHVFSRIDYSKTYMCFLNVIVRKKSDPQYDSDLICICNIHPVSQCGIYLWRTGIKFSKVPQKYLDLFLEDTEKSMEKVLNQGYDLTLKEVLAKEYCGQNYRQKKATSVSVPPFTKKYRVGYDKISKSPIYEELTYEFFSQHVDYEWNFNYGGQSVDITWHNLNGGKIYELNIDGYDENKAIRYEFNSAEELLQNGRINGKTLKEIWDELNN